MEVETDRNTEHFHLTDLAPRLNLTQLFHKDLSHS